MSYLEAKYHLLGGWRVIGIILNIIVFCGGGLALYHTGIFTRYLYNQNNAVVCMLVMVTSFLSTVLISQPVIIDNPESENAESKGSFLTLWFKRRKLEEQQRIRELESKK
ncbi:TPA: hypothetical protein ACTXAA_001229 [Raoultella planticola]|uniref:hypothetical protein n=1 Tax=Klebsiella michiganensis TaxID=1134687 RepID=UPI001C81FB3A|nr:hypothetical protein [Klebsiella michiganensis]MBX4817452.1 hypothetical protein [Klebsiella michiganensis]